MEENHFNLHRYQFFLWLVGIWYLYKYEKSTILERFLLRLLQIESSERIHWILKLPDYSTGLMMKKEDWCELTFGWCTMDTVTFGGRRTCIERRQFSYIVHVPERRSEKDRRSGSERRSMRSCRLENCSERRRFLWTDHYKSKTFFSHHLRIPFS